MSYVADGTYYCRGTFQALADALVEALAQRGGELTLRSAVRRILVEDGRAAGVVLENGQCVRAPLVVSNADARQTVEELVGGEHFPRRYRQRLLAASAFDLGLRRLRGHLARPRGLRPRARDLPLRRAPTTTPRSRAGALDPGRALRALVALASPHRACSIPGLAPAGEHLLVLTTLVSAQAARALARREAGLPGGAAAPRRAPAARAARCAALRRGRHAAHLRALHAQPRRRALRLRRDARAGRARPARQRDAAAGPAARRALDTAGRRRGRGRALGRAHRSHRARSRARRRPRTPVESGRFHAKGGIAMRRIASIVLVVSMSALGLAACANRGGGGTAAAPAQQAAPAQKAPAQQAAPAKPAPVKGVPAPAGSKLSKVQMDMSARAGARDHGRADEREVLRHRASASSRTTTAPTRGRTPSGTTRAWVA